jgi:threonine/homoserine/homoserine lactone efflux protein
MAIDDDLPVSGGTLTAIIAYVLYFPLALLGLASLIEIGRAAFRFVQWFGPVKSRRSFAVS